MIGFAMSLERYIVVRKDVPKDNATARFLCYSWMPRWELLRGVEKVVGGVRHTNLLAGVHGIASGRGRFATFGVEAPNGRGAREHAAALVAHDVNEKPGNRIRIWRGHIRDSFARNTASIFCFPGWPSKMFAEGFAVFVEELGVGSLQRPSELRGTLLTDIDLIALRMNLKQKLFAGGRLELLRNFLRGGRE